MTTSRGVRASSAYRWNILLLLASSQAIAYIGGYLHIYYVFAMWLPAISSCSAAGPG